MPIWEVNIAGILLGQAHQNVLHFSDEGFPVITAPTVATRIRDQWLDQIKTLHTSNLVYNTITVRDLQAPGVAPTTLAINIPGTIGSDSNMLPFASMVILKQTATAGRHGHGRYYVGGLPTVAYASGLLTAARIAGFETMRTVLEPRWIGGGATGGMALGVCDRTGGLNWTACVRIVARAVVGVQRRRNIGIGI